MGIYIYPNSEGTTFTGGTVSGNTYFVGNLSAGTFYSGATLFENIFLTSGTPTGSGFSLVNAKQGSLLGIKTLVEGLNIAITDDGNQIIISADTGQSTFVQPGVNIYTGGTPYAPTVNLSSDISVNSISASTINSGNTNLSSIFSHTGHTHQFSSILNTAHTHSISDVIGVTDLFNTKVNKSGDTMSGTLNVPAIITTAITSNNFISGNTNIDVSFSHTGHTHEFSTILNTAHTHEFSTILNTAHTHSISDVTNLQNLLNTKVSKSGDTMTGQLNALAISANTISGSTLFSGNTNLYDIFMPIGSISESNHTVINGINTFTAGTNDIQSINVTGLTITDLRVSGYTVLSSTTASTLTVNSLSGGGVLMVVSDNNGNLSTQSIPLAGQSTIIRNGLNIYTAGTTADYYINVSALTVNTIFASGNSVFSGSLSGGSNFSASIINSGSTNINNIFSHTGHTHEFSTILNTAHTHSVFNIEGLTSLLDAKVNKSGDTMTGGLIVPSLSGTVISGGTYYSGDTPLSSLFGEVNNVFSVGSGTTIFSGKSGPNLYFHTISGGTNIVVQTGETITIHSVPGADSAILVGVATTARLNVIYNNGTLGIGSMLSGLTNGILANQDGVPMHIGYTLLVKNQSALTENGIYVVTSRGTASSRWVLTRTDFSDETYELNDQLVFVESGTTQKGQYFNQTTAEPEVGTDNIVYGLLGGVSTYVTQATALTQRVGQIPVWTGTARALAKGDENFVRNDTTKFVGINVGPNPITTFDISGGTGLGTVHTVLSSMTITNWHKTILASANTTDITIILSAASLTNRREFNISKIDASVNKIIISAVTLSGVTSLIDGQSYITLSKQWDTTTLKSNGSNYYSIVLPSGFYFTNSGGTITGSTYVSNNFSATTIYSGGTNIEDLFVVSGRNMESSFTPIFNGKSGNNLLFKTLRGGTNITLSVGANTVRIDNGLTIPSGAYLWTAGTTPSSIVANNGTLGQAGAFNLIAGKSNYSNSSYNFIGNGLTNVIQYYSNFSSIVGGSINNFSNSTYSFIGGGRQNLMTYSNYSLIIGGKTNSLDGYGGSFVSGGTIVGGAFNTITQSQYPVIVGGRLNKIGDASRFPYESSYSTIINGKSSYIVSKFSSVNNGNLNTIKYSKYATVANGNNNIIETGYHNAIFGGSYNTGCSSYHGVIINGYYNKNYGKNGIIGNGYNNYIQRGVDHTTILNGFQNRALYVNLISYNQVNPPASFIIGYNMLNIMNGVKNSASTTFSTVLNGKLNVSLGINNFVAQGDRNKIYTAYYSSIINGSQNHIRGFLAGNPGFGFTDFNGIRKYNSISNGKNNYISSYNSSIFNGNTNKIYGKYNTIVNGQYNTINILSFYNVILNGQGHILRNQVSNSSILGGISNTISSGLTNVSILGISGAVALSSNTIYVDSVVARSLTGVTTRYVLVESDGHLIVGSAPTPDSGATTSIVNTGSTHGIWAGTNNNIAVLKALSAGTNMTIYSSATENTISLNSNITVTNLSATTISGGTFYSASTNIESIFSHSGHTHQFSTILNTAHTHSIYDVDNLSNLLNTKVNRSGDTMTGQLTTTVLSATTISGGTIYSASTNIDALFSHAGHTHQFASILNTAHTHSVSEVSNLQSNLDTKVNKSGDTMTGGLTTTTLSALTISGGTIYSASTNIDALFSHVGHTHQFSTILNTAHTHSLSEIDNLSNLLNTKLNKSGDTMTGVLNALELSGTSISAATYYSGSTLLSSLLGEVNTASNIGPGSGLFAQKSGTNLQFKGISAGTNITFSVNLDTISINATGGPGGGSSVSNGINTFTGGSSTVQTVNVTALTIDNITVSGNTSLQSLSATSIISGITNINNIFAHTGHTHNGGIGFTIDNGASVITTGFKGYVIVPYNATVQSWTIVADVSGSIEIDVWKDTYANYPPTIADSIAGTEKINLISQLKNQDLSLTSWNTTLSSGDILAFNVDSVSTVKRVTVMINVIKLN